MLTKSLLKRHVGTACLRVQRFVTEIGERHGIEMLVYNPLVTYGYKRAARRSAPVIARSIHEYWPHIRTCIDCGCGLGQYVEEITRCGIQCDGVEYSATVSKALWKERSQHPAVGSQCTLLLNLASQSI